MTPRKKIAFVVSYLTHYRLTFYEKLYSRAEYEWRFFHGVKEHDDGRPAYQGKLDFPNRPVGYDEWKIGPFYIRWQAGVLRLVREWQPDVVITQGIPSILTNWLIMDWAKRSGAKTITWHCAWEPHLGNPMILAFKQWLHRRYLLLVDHTLTYSTSAASYIESLGYDHRKLTVCYNGLEIDDLLAREGVFRAKGTLLRRQYQLGQERLFLYVGGMAADKQVPLLLDAFEAIQGRGGAVLWLVGDGPELSALKSRAAVKNMRTVQFWGRIVDEVDALFAAADYFVLPGLGGLALNQALFWGLPCVAGDADGTEDDLVLEGQTGFRFRAGNAQSLEIALRKCLELPDKERIAFGAAGRALVLERSNVNQMVSTFIRSIDELLAS